MKIVIGTNGEAYLKILNLEFYSGLGCFYISNKWVPSVTGYPKQRLQISQHGDLCLIFAGFHFKSSFNFGYLEGRSGYFYFGTPTTWFT